MNYDWVSSVDMLADAGIVGFDAAAYVTGTPARFVGRPQYPVYNIPPLAIQPPKSDEYNNHKKVENIVKTPVWKKVLFGALALTGIVWGVAKLRKMPSCLKSFGSKIGDFFKNLFKKKP